MCRPRRRTAIVWLCLFLVLLGASADSSRLQAAGASVTAPLDVRLEFRAATFGTSIGEAGLEAADLDGDGALEIVVAAAGPAPFWYVLSHRGSGYRQTWVSAVLPDRIDSLVVAPVDADAAPEILLGTGDKVHVYDGNTRELEWVIDTTASEIGSLLVADVDSDSAPEIVFCDPTGLYVYDAHTGAAEVQSLLDGCEGVAVGNVDADPGLEIVVGNGASMGYVLDGATRATEWAYPLGFGITIRLGDVDGDAIAEIVGSHGWDQISVLDAVNKVEENAVYPFQAGDVQVVDVEGDGANEVVYGDAQGGEIHVLNGATLAQKWEVDNPNSGVTRILVADTDEDGMRELVWGGGNNTSFADHLYVVDTVTRQTEWQSLDFNGPFYGLAHGDVEGNGKPAFLFTSFQSDGGYEGGLYFIYGAVNKRLRYVSPPEAFGLVRIQVANLDSDPQLEVLVGASDIDGVLICYDGLTHAEQWRAPIDTGLSIWGLQVADVDGDGQLEAVIGTRFEHSGAPGVFVYVVDAATGAREWRSPNLQSGPLSLLRVAQVDADPAPEILVGEYQGRLFMFDGITHVVSVLVADGVTALDTQERRVGGRSDILVGTEDGDLFRLRLGRSSERIGRFDGQINGLAAHDLTGDGVADYTFAVNERVTVMDGRTRAIPWQSVALAPGWFFETAVGAHDSIVVADIDQDGRQEIMVNTGSVGVDIYEVAGEP